jgi:hypothetical protein
MVADCTARRVLADKARSRYMTRRNVEAELTFRATALNLLKAANQIELAAV